jgi:hypothetical protein
MRCHLVSTLSVVSDAPRERRDFRGPGGGSGGTPYLTSTGRSGPGTLKSCKVPELTLDRTVRLLEAALEEPELRLPRATALVDYHVRRNEVARKSHAKTWRAKHRGVKFLRL